MSVSYYLIVDGMDGDQPLGDLGAGLALADFSLDEAFQIGSLGRAGEFSLSDISLTVSGFTGLSQFMSGVLQPEAGITASIVGLDEAGVLVFRTNLGDVSVTSVSLNQDNLMLLTLGYGSIQVTTPIDTESQPFEAGDPPPPEAATGGGAAPVDLPIKWFLVLPGIDGGSSVANYEGWFRVGGFDLAALRDDQSVAIDPLQLTLSDRGALPDLLALLASDTILPNARLVALTDSDAIAYQLDLSKVLIGGVSTGSGPGYQVSLDYQMLNLTMGDPAAALAPPSYYFDRTAVTPPSPDTETPDLTDDQIDPGAHVGAPIGAMNFYLEASALGGPVITQGLEGAFKVNFFNIDAANGGFSIDSGGKAQVAKPQFGEVTVSFADETGLSAFLALETSGQAISALSVVGIGKVANAPAEGYRLNLQNAVVTGVHENGAGGYEVSFAYARIGISTREKSADGTQLLAPNVFGYDLAQQQANDSMPPDAHPGAVAGVVSPVHYLVRINGVQGDSSDADHPGWFELTDFNLDAETLAAFSGGGGAQISPTSFAALELSLTHATAIAQLLTLQSQGGGVPGVTIQGFDGKGAVVYQLELGDVLLTRLSDNEADGLNLGLDFGQVRLTTTGQRPNGDYDVPQTFSWNLQTQTAAVNIPGPDAGGKTQQSLDGLVWRLEVDAVEGSSTEAGAEGAFDVDSFSFEAISGAAAQGDILDTGAIHLRLRDDAGLAAFMSLLTAGRLESGESVIGVSLVGSSATDAGPVDAYAFDLAGIRVEALTDDGEGGFDLTLSYGALGVREPDAFTPQFSWRPIVEAPADPAPPAVDQTGSSAPIAATRYFLVIDGLDGKTTDENHRGAFDLSSFELDLTGRQGVIFGGPMTPPSGSVQLEFATPHDLTALMQMVAEGDAFDGMRIEGVDDEGVVVYTLTLANAFLTDLQMNGRFGVNVTLTALFERMELETQGADEAAQHAAWNFATFSTDVGVMPTIAPAGQETPPSDPPATPSAPDLAAASDTGVSSTDNLTSAAPPTFTGTADPGAVVKLFEGGVEIGVGAADASGVWTITTPVLSGGVHAIVAQAFAAGQASAQSGALQVTVDDDAPEVVSITLSDSALKIGDTTEVSVTFSEAVSGFDAADVTVGGGVLGPFTANGAGTVWTATFTPAADTEASGLAVTAAGAGWTDLAGNAPSAGGTSSAFTVDTRRPTVTSVVLSDSLLTIGQTAALTVTFSEAVTSFDAADVSISGGALGSFAASSGGKVWTATFTPAAGLQASNLTASVAGSGWTDVAGNAPAAGATSAAFAIDTLAPVPSVSAVTKVKSGWVIGGQSDPGSSIVVTENGVTVATATADGSGAWSASTTWAKDKTHILTVTATDAAGNVGSLSGKTFLGSVAGDTFIGSAGDDLMLGFDGNDVLGGGGGADRLDGGGGKDELTGGLGDDVFVYGLGYGKTRIADFQVGHDHVEFARGLFGLAAGATDAQLFAALQARVKTSGADLVVQFDNQNVLTLTGAAAAGLHIADVLFV